MTPSLVTIQQLLEDRKSGDLNLMRKEACEKEYENGKVNQLDVGNKKDQHNYKTRTCI